MIDMICIVLSTFLFLLFVFFHLVLGKLFRRLRTFLGVQRCISLLHFEIFLARLSSSLTDNSLENVPFLFLPFSFILWQVNILVDW